jgi:hypothetical protein
VIIAVEVLSPKGFGRVRIRQIPDVTGASLVSFICEVAEKGSEILTDGWGGYNQISDHRYTHNRVVLSDSGGILHTSVPGVHRLAALVKRWLAIDMVIVWRIFYLTMQGREAPDLPCGVYFTPNEWKALTTFVHKIKEPPTEPPTLNEAVALLGRLGGHLGRAGDAPPGSEVLWRGMTRLADISEAYRLYH